MSKSEDGIDQSTQKQLYNQSTKSLKIPKGKQKSVIRRRTDNTIVKGKRKSKQSTAIANKQELEKHQILEKSRIRYDAPCIASITKS